ncbi:hypothetical protein ED811_15085 [Escherichia coli]|nr:hypothetical protein [Escherichia coli]EFB2740618.1 hypothetical protein [Escherichia coli]EFI5935105.1 hypothetical protein [Escherichia coli]MFY80797.1 hypothetical protein [Escherichia coli]
MFTGKKSAQIREILISESAWEEMTCLFAPSLGPKPIAKSTGKPDQRRRDNKDTPGNTSGLKPSKSTGK